jgi:hypothetical protein
MVKPFSFIIALSLLCFAACTNNETQQKKDLIPSQIYFDYKIRGQETDSSVSVYLLYRKNGPGGNTIKLSDPAKVELDGERMAVDSAKLAGAFYDVEIPAKGFEGKHTIVFTDFDSKEHSVEFNYKPFKLKTKIPSVTKRGDLVFDFVGLANEDYLRVILADTSFLSPDIHEIDTIMNNRLVIPADKLKNLVNGPVVLILSKEIERLVYTNTITRGKILVSYGMQREFELAPSRPPPKGEATRAQNLTN